MRVNKSIGKIFHSKFERDFSAFCNTYQANVDITIDTHRYVIDRNDPTAFTIVETIKNDKKVTTYELKVLDMKTAKPRVMKHIESVKLLNAPSGRNMSYTLHLKDNAK
jgi:hypothetical protein